MQEQLSTEPDDTKLNTHTPGARVSTSEIDLMDIVRDLWQARYTLAGSLVLAIFLALLSLMFEQKSYTSEAVLGPAENSAEQGLGSSLGQLSGAASLLGVNLGQGSDSDFMKFKQLLSSERLAKTLFQDDSLKAVFFGPTWIPATRTWKKPTSIVFAIKDFVKGVLGLPRWQVPEPYTLEQVLKLQLDVQTDKVTGYVKVSIDEDSPASAAFTLNKIIKVADNLVRQDVKDRTAGRIAYLTNVLERAQLQDQREAIITVLSSQEKTLMMTLADKTYAIDVIDPPTNSSIPTSPMARVTLLTNVIVAIVLVSLGATLRGHFFVRYKRAISEAAARETSFDAAVRKWLETRWTKLRSSNLRNGAIFRRANNVISRH